MSFRVQTQERNIPQSSHTQSTWAKAKGDVIRHLFKNNRLKELDKEINTRNINFFVDVLFEEPLIIVAANQGKQQFVQLAIKKGASKNVSNKFERTALHVAALKGHFQIIKDLVSSGVDVNARDYLRNTPLLLAAKKGELKCIELLVNNKADLEAENTDGDTALKIACEKKNLEAIKLLVARGAEFKFISKNLLNKNILEAISEGLQNRNLSKVSKL